MPRTKLLKLKTVAIALAVFPAPAAFAQQAVEDGITQETLLPTVKVTATAEEALKQAPGVSIISAEDLEKQPPSNDLSDIIRRMPGVNLTGNSSSGTHGNSRQIDLRGMGPENTLILIDGKPVSSRNSVRYGRSGERDTRGDSNWVPAEDVESIEVIRGPAAARYGSGAAGGVVNIVTKGISEKPQGSITAYTSQPQHEDEGATNRVNFNTSGPIGEDWGYRLYGNVNRTDADSPDINVDHTVSELTAAGREGVNNKDLSGLFRWKASADNVVDLNLAYSRQGNIYAGDTTTQGSATDGSAATGSNPASFLGQETNTMTRYTASIEHKGVFDFGNTDSYFQYEKTDNNRLGESLGGGGEGNISSAEKFKSRLNSYTLHSELNSPLKFGVPQTLTAGVEWNYQHLDDPASIVNGESISGVAGLADNAADRETTSDATMVSAFVEDNIAIGSALILTPGVRLDNHSDFGNNWSPSLNAAYTLRPGLTLKGGIARAFKAPNLYQSNPNYLYYSKGNGCNNSAETTVRCYILGNDDLDPEVSVNKELGINWNANGWNAGISWFRNDYSSKIVTGTQLLATVTVSGQERYVYQWENASNAIVEGYEGNLQIPLARNVTWNNNFTYMLRNDDQDGQPLSVIPEYTVNTTLDWQVTGPWSLTLTGTFYGKQEPRTTAYNTGLSATGTALNGVDPYNIWGVSSGYTFDRTWKGRIGISNLFDKRLFREGNGASAGAATYNEAGRAYYATITAAF